MVALAIFAIISTGTIFVSVDALQAGRVSKERFQALALAQQGLEASRSIRNQDWSKLQNGTFDIVINSNVWEFVRVPASLIQDKYKREITISDHTADEKKIVSRVTWSFSPSRSQAVELQSILTNWKQGVITPAIPPWTNPYLAGSIDLPGNADANRVYVQNNTAYVIRASSNQAEFYTIDITNPATPSILGSLELNAGANDLVVSGNFAYIASENNSQELQIININNPTTPTLAGSFNAPGNTDANALAIKNQTIYLVRANSSNPELISINVSSPTTPTQISALDLGAGGYSVSIRSNFAYIASGHNSEELQIINISQTTMSFIGVSNQSGNQDGISVLTYNTAQLLFGRDIGTTAGFQLLDSTNPQLIQPVGSLNPDQRVNQIASNESLFLAFLATNNSQSELQIADLAKINNQIISLRGLINLSGNALGVYHSPSKNITYIASTDNAQELQILLPKVP